MSPSRMMAAIEKCGGRVRLVDGRVKIQNPGAVSVELRATGEQYRLFARYERSRHAKSEMAAMTFGDYRAMIEESPIETRLIEFRDRDRALCRSAMATPVIGLFLRVARPPLPIGVVAGAARRFRGRPVRCP